MVDILLATYNGEKYIRAQLLSLLFQTEKNIRVIVHDDGSTDNTVEIVREIAKKDGRINLIEDGVTFGNAAQNFMHLLKFSHSEAIMFCDQDDIWFDEKVSKMLEQLNGRDNSIPQVIYSESYVWYPGTGVDGLMFRQHPKNVREFLFTESGIQGCASMFNAKARDLLLRWRGWLVMHDYVLALLGLSLGEVTFFSTPQMLYRRHKDTVTACSKQVTWKDRLFRNRAVPVVSGKHYRTVKRFTEIYDIELRGKTSELVLLKYLSMKDENWFQRLFSLTRYRFKIYDSLLVLLVKYFLRPYFKE